MGKEYYIDHIKVLGRSDNYDAAYRLNRATLMLDDKTIGSFVFIDMTSPFVFPLGGVKGQVVKIVKLANYLTLCEVQVMVNHEFEPDESYVNPIDMEKTNLAATATITSSSSMFGGPAAVVSDQDTNANFFSGSCFYGAPIQNNNWVKLELAETANVGKVYIYPRLDNDAETSIDGALVRAGDHTCGEVAYEAGKLVYEIDCGGSGEVTEVTVSKLGWLTICEVVVHAAES